MILLIIDRKDGTFACTGPFDSKKAAEGHADFIGHFKPKFEFYVKNVYHTNQYGAPIYPFPTGDYADDEEHF
jgi:hypothetical protein